MNQPATTDVIGLFVFILSVAFSPEIAAVVGPYVAITVAAAIGASFSLARRGKSTRLDAIWFFGRICGLAILIAGAMAAGLAQLHPALTERSLLAPVAFLIGIVGEDWKEFGDWLLKFVHGLLLRKYGGGGDK